MHDIPEIDLDTAQRCQKDGTHLFVDIRDPGSYAAARIPNAVPLSDRNVQQFVAETDRKCALVVYCYHGHSSLDATAYLLDQGFESVQSLRGGFEQWRHHGPVETSSR